MKEIEIQYRILYDSLSRFSIHLNKTKDLTDIHRCLLQNIKYLYNYSQCRFACFHDHHFIQYDLSAFDAEPEAGSNVRLCETEREVFNSGIPYYEKNDKETNGGDVWIWKFEYSTGAGVLVTLRSDSTMRFSKEQIPVLKIASEMLYTKTRMVLLLNDLRQKQEALTDSCRQLEESNKIISTLISTQEKIIEDRTRALTQSNADLLDLVQFNSHNIREPLTRIIGLMRLRALTTGEEFFDEYWPLLETSVGDLDNTVKQVILKTKMV